MLLAYLHRHSHVRGDDDVESAERLDVRSGTVASGALPARAAACPPLPRLARGACSRPRGSRSVCIPAPRPDATHPPALPPPPSGARGRVPASGARPRRNRGRRRRAAALRDRPARRSRDGRRERRPRPRRLRHARDGAPEAAREQRRLRDRRARALRWRAGDTTPCGSCCAKRHAGLRRGGRRGRRVRERRRRERAEPARRGDHARGRGGPVPGDSLVSRLDGGRGGRRTFRARRRRGRNARAARRRGAASTVPLRVADRRHVRGRLAVVGAGHPLLHRWLLGALRRRALGRARAGFAGRARAEHPDPLAQPRRRERERRRDAGRRRRPRRCQPVLHRRPLLG